MTAMTIPWLQSISEPPHGDYGELVIEMHYPEPTIPVDRWITIQHADPRILVRPSLLGWWASGRDLVLPWVKVGRDCVCLPGCSCRCFRGATLEIEARDRKVIYVIGEFEQRFDAYSAEWPD